MDETSRGYPYPECDPPLTKDVSDLPAQLKALADAVDADMTAVALQADTELIRPQLARIREAAASPPWASQLVTPNYDAVDFDTHGMFDAPNNGLRIQSSGWYYLGTFCIVLIAAAVEINARTRIIRNGQPLTNNSDQARLASATAEDPYVSTTAFLDEGDLIRTQIIHSGPGATAFTTQSRLWAMQLVAV